MSELSLNIAPTPELLNAASSVAPATARRDPGTPANDSVPANPFAALLSGILQGTQPLAPNAELSVPGSARPPAQDEQPEAGADPLALLALPGNATPLPATPGGSADAGRVSGNTLPVSGNPLPAELTPPGTVAGNLPEPAPAPDPAAPPETTPPPAARPRISLADLAFTRPLEQAPDLATAGTVDGARTAAAFTLAGRSLTASRAVRDEGPPLVQNLAQNLAQNLTQNLTQGVESASAQTSTDELVLRLTAADFLRGTVVPGAGTEFLVNQLAAFAAGNDSAGALAGAAPATGPGGADTANAALLSRPGSTTLPALQPLGDARGFASGLADRLLTLGGPGTHSARLQLHPEHLGELNVEIRIDDGSAQVWFGTTTSQARDAIQASLPHLRELFADQGIQITRTQVDTGSSQMGSPDSDQQRRMAASVPWQADLPWRPARSGSIPGGGFPPAARASTRLVDVWA